MNVSFTVLVGLALSATPFEVQSLDGQTLRGQLVDVSAEALSVEVDGQTKSLPLKELLALSPAEKPQPHPAPPGAWVELVDGSLLLAAGLTTQGAEAALLPLGGGDLKLPAAVVASVRFRAQDEAIAAQWQKIRNANRSADVLVVRKGEKLDYLEGVLGPMTAEELKFTLQGETIPVKRSRVEGVIYFRPPGMEIPPAICQVVDAAGSSIAAQRLAMNEPGNLEITLIGGATLLRPVDQLARLDFSQGKILYLSDLEPLAVEYTPFFAPSTPLPELQQFFQPRRDRAFGGGKLRLGEQTFARGLALHSRTEIRYQIPAGFRRFQAVAGIDAGQEGRGDVRLVISADDRVLFDEPIRGRDATRSIDVPIDQVRRLTILVDFGEDLDISDHLNLCEARITK